MSAAAAPGAVAAPASRRLRAMDVAVFAAIAYVPFLLSSPGKVSGDTKQYLYLDPGRLMSRAVSLWDPHIGTGTVPHQNVGYLFPLGPYYWIMDQLSVPDWVAQRLWMGSISFAAALGTLWLLTKLGTGRVGAIAGAVVYLLAPYQLAFTARLSVLLLPWAGLPWLVGLTIRAAARRGWRDPVLFALVVLLIGGTNASSLLFVGIAPVLWLVVAAVQGSVRPRDALATAGRIALPTIGVSLWWAAGLVDQARYGVPVLDVTETLRQVATVARPDDLLRGFGNWFFEGRDRLGPWLDQSAEYQDRQLLVYATLAVPLAGLVSAAFVRWRHRAYFVALVVMGTIVAVGAWPYDDPSPVGSLFKSFAGRAAAGAALRNTPRVGPLIVLGIAGLIAAAVGGLRRRHAVQLVAAGGLCVVVIAAFLPVWRNGYLSSRILRDDDVPAYWHEVAAALDRSDDGTRALELPGSLFAAYRWGNTVDPITPGLTDRPWVARELIPFGTRGSVDLLAALDRRLQQGTFEPAALAPVARLLAVGTIVDRNDLEYERYDTPRPRALWSWLTEPLAPGFAEPVGYGGAAPNRASTLLPMLDELELRTSGTAWPPHVALFAVTSPRTIVSTASTDAPLVLAGDGEGVVDAAAAGLVGGDGVLLYAASLDSAELRRALVHDAALVVTDTARRRARRWGTLKDDVGETERAGQRSLVEDPDDFRYEITPDLTDRDRTVVETRGGTVDATAYGDPGAYVPSERPARAFDGDVRTAWRVAEGGVPSGERLVLRLDDPVRTGGIRIVQPASALRFVTSVRVRLNGGRAFDAALDDRSRSPEGQRIRFPAERVRTLELEPLTVGEGPQDAVGFAEVRIDGRADTRALVDEVVRVPTRLLRRAGATAAERRVGFVFTRARGEPADRGRVDEELALARRFVLPESATGGTGRPFALSGTARVNPNAPDGTLDVVLGTRADGARFEASGHRAGDASARASRAFDGDPATAWEAPFGPEAGQAVAVDLDAPTTVQGATIRVVVDGRHSVPTRMHVEADGTTVATIDLPEIADGSVERATREVPFEFGPVTARRLRFVVDETRVVETVDDRTFDPVALPVGIAEIGATGIPQAPVAGAPDGACRADLLRLDGAPLRVRVGADGALGGCDEPLGIAAGRHSLRSAVGLDTGIDVDRVVLTSGADGSAASAASFRAAAPRSGARVRVVDHGATTYDLRVRTDGRPFWLVLGESHSEGWKADVSGAPTGDRSLGAPRLVNGYANGWLVDPHGAGTIDVRLRWTGQTIVWVAFALSLLAIGACLAVVYLTRRRPVPDIGGDPELGSPFDYDADVVPWRMSIAAAAAAGVGAWLVSRPWIGLVVAAGTLAASRVRGARIVLSGGAPAALLLAQATDTPELAWLAILLLAADLLTCCVSHRHDEGRETHLDGTRPSGSSRSPDPAVDEGR
ncbi:MAG TPA: alpha-(1-_3)-arabinofuranosyltransferase family protein, partial [Acidimicrobiia bacterium]